MTRRVPRAVMAGVMGAALAGFSATRAPEARADHNAAHGHPRPLDADCEHFWPNQTPGVTLETIVVATGPDYEGVLSEVHGCLAYPTEAVAASVDTLVVTVHGNGHTVQNAWAHHLVEVAALGVAAVGVNFRDNFAFPTMQGAEDTIAATLVALERFPDVTRVILVGASMGGAISGTAITQAPRFTRGLGLYDHWIALEPVTNVAESWAEARAVGNTAAAGIERDAGGTPDQVPEAYRERSPLMNARGMADAGLESAVVVHAVFDGLVPYWQGRSMWAALQTAGVPTEFHTVVRGSGDGADTDPLSHASQDLSARQGETIDLAGHAWEGDRNHPVVDAGLERLFALIRGVAVDPTTDEVIDRP